MLSPIDSAEKAEFEQRIAMEKMEIAMMER